MKKRRGKHKRGKRGFTEEEVNSAKKPNMEAADCTNNDNEVEELEVDFYETVSEQEPSLKDIKDMLSCVQATLKDIQKDGRRTGQAKVFLRLSRTTTKFPQGVSKEGDKGKRRNETKVTSAEREI